MGARLQVMVKSKQKMKAGRKQKMSLCVCLPIFYISIEKYSSYCIYLVYSVPYFRKVTNF